MKKSALIPILLCVLAFLAAPAGAAPSLTVFVSVLPQKFFVKRIAGDRAKVLVMVGPGRSPATYEPTPKQMALLGDASLYFGIGVPFERVWLPRIAAANSSMKVIVTGEGLARAEPAVVKTEPDNHGHGGGDPHVWTSPLAAIGIARAVASALVEADPVNAGEYRRRFEVLEVELQDLDREIEAIIEPLPRRTFYVFHPSWGAFAERYGLEQVAIEQGGGEPGARHLASLIERARREKAGAVFIQPQFDRRNAETVARAIGARIVSLDPLAEEYLLNLRAAAAAFAEELR